MAGYHGITHQKKFAWPWYIFPSHPTLYHMHIDDLADLLDRYRLNQCTPEERHVVEEWYESLKTHPSIPGDTDIQESLDKVSARLEQALQSGPLESAKPEPKVNPESERYPDVVWLESRTHKPYKRALVAAAGILLIFCCWKFWWSSRNWGSTVEGTAEDSVWVSTAPAETKKMILPDGTLVQLNAGTSFGYPANFGVERKVRLLRGEAFFEVAPDPQRPFIVLAAQTKTTVLGTSFNIRAYEKDKGVAIALVTGKVSVSIPNVSTYVTLTPHNRLSYDSTTNSFQTHHFDKEQDVAAWRDKAISFHDADFDEIALQLKNLYNIELINESNRKHWSYTGYFASENVTEIANTICITENLSYTSDQNRIIIINKK
jgi:transmembrane sensor